MHKSLLQAEKQKLCNLEVGGELLMLNEAVSASDVVHWQDSERKLVSDCLAEETPVALVYNGVSHAVMLATPQDLEDFALGFSLSEGVVQELGEFYGVEVQYRTNGIELHCEIASGRFMQLKERRRTLAGRTGCGLCGTESLDQAVRSPQLLQTVEIFSANTILQAIRAIQSQQVLQQRTGATHASAYVGREGIISLLREDIGRHNALDKLIGAIATGGMDRRGFIVTTSRASYEMVQKAASVGVSMLVALSAPTALAVRMAKACGLILVGFARDKRFVVYSCEERILN